MTNSSQTYDNLVTMFELSVTTHKDRELFGSKKDGRWQWLTYGQFADLVGRFRAALKALGVGPGDRVAVIANNQLPWAVGAYAVYGLGAAYVPMYESQLDKDLHYILGDSGAKLCLVSNQKLLSRVQAFRGDLKQLSEVVTFDASGGELSFDQLVAKQNVPAPAYRPKSSELATLIYTSGTTGNPKGVELSHKNITANIWGVHQIIPFTEGDRTLAFLPWAHVFGGSIELHTVVSTGSSAAICGDTTKIVEYLAEVRPTVLFAVPEIWKRIYAGVGTSMQSKPAAIRALYMRTMATKKAILAGKSVGLVSRLIAGLGDRLVLSKIRDRFGGRLQYAVSGAAALSREVSEFIAALGIAIYEGYGMTECAGVVSSNEPKHRKAGTIGPVLPGLTVKIDREVAAADGENGEIIVYGDSVMTGYHNLPDETKASFTADGGFRTGDLGRLDADGYLYITGRVKELYKLENGKYVVPGLIEEQLGLSPLIAQVMVWGQDRPYNVAVVVPNQANLSQSLKDRATDQAAIEQLLTDEITRQSSGFKGYERVKRFVLASEPFSTDNDMLTPSMKVKRRNVYKRYESAIQALYT